MSAIETFSSPRPVSGEAPFDFTELFYSRTDDRGVIRAGNTVFRRVADYDWDQMIGAPHRLIRHPDMPKAVFWLIWDRIKAGKPTGAYMKNRARDGLHYWVYAIFTPTEGGYLSVRLKPSSPMFHKVQSLYAELLENEKAGLSPTESAAEMLRRLHEFGCPSYIGFQATALAAELKARARACGRPVPARLFSVAEIPALLHEAIIEKRALLDAFEEIRAIPTNLHIVASRLEVYGGPVSTIAENYRLMSFEITRRLHEITGGASGEKTLGNQILATVGDALFLTGAARIQAEVAAQCLGSSELDWPIDARSEGTVLRGLERDYRDRANAGLAEVARAAAALTVTCAELKRLLLGLDSIRVMCRVEAGRLTSGAEGLQAIILRLDQFHTDVGKRLGRIVDLARRARAAADAAMRADV